mmetsp:Transcript_2723/g.5628  ORF Transcript_2723/g.5628 Transcript_2723/m.5628 type:complete len:242 (+) Transcript_2723:3038-3763(+)
MHAQILGGTLQGERLDDVGGGNLDHTFGGILRVHLHCHMGAFTTLHLRKQLRVLSVVHLSALPVVCKVEDVHSKRAILRGVHLHGRKLAFGLVCSAEACAAESVQELRQHSGLVRFRVEHGDAVVLDQSEVRGYSCLTYACQCLQVFLLHCTRNTLEVVVGHVIQEPRDHLLSSTSIVLFELIYHRLSLVIHHFLRIHDAVTLLIIHRAGRDCGRHPRQIPNPAHIVWCHSRPECIGPPRN